MGRQRSNPQMKGKEEASERMLTEIEASQLSDTEFKAMVIRKSWLKHTPRICWGPESTYNSLKLQDQLFKPYTGLGH